MYEYKAIVDRVVDGDTIDVTIDLGFKTWKKENHFLKNKIKSLKIVAIDYGIKKNILRYFSDFKCDVNIVSCKTSAE